MMSTYHIGVQVILILLTTKNDDDILLSTYIIG